MLKSNLKRLNYLLLRTPKERKSSKRRIPLYKDEEIKGEESDEDIDTLKNEIKSLAH